MNQKPNEAKESEEFKDLSQELEGYIDTYKTEGASLKKKKWLKIAGLTFLSFCVLFLGYIALNRHKAAIQEKTAELISDTHRTYSKADLVDGNRKEQAFTFEDFLTMKTSISSDDVFTLDDFLETYGKADSVALTSSEVSDSIVLTYKAKDFKGTSAYQVKFYPSAHRSYYYLSGITYDYDSTSDEFPIRDQADYLTISEDELKELTVYDRDKDKIAGIEELTTLGQNLEKFGNPHDYDFWNNSGTTAAFVTYKSAANKGITFRYVYNPSVKTFFMDKYDSYKID